MKSKLSMPIRTFVAMTIFLLIGFMTVLLDGLTTYEGITVSVLALIVCTLIVLKQTTGEIFSFAVLFLLFSYIMHLGHPLLLSLGYDRVLGFDQRGYTTPEIYIRACQFSAKAQFWLMLGMMLGSLKTYQLRTTETPRILDMDLNKDYLQKTYIVGLNLFFVTLLPRAYVDLSKILLYLQGGYLKTYSLNVNGYIQVLAKMLDLAVLVIIVASKNNEHRARWWMLGMCTYHFLFMLTGNRGDAVMRIIVMLLVYSKIFPSRNLSLGKVIGGICGIWISVAILSALGTLRLDGMTLQQFYNQIVKNLFGEPAVLKIFSEFGVTIKTVCFAIETFPQIHPYSYGMNYIKGSLAFLPNIGGFITNSIKELVYVYYFRNSSVIGGSYIGELYYAFGPIGCLLAAFIGFFVSRIDFIRIAAQLSQNWKKFLVSIVFITPCIWWIRDYYYTCVREIVMSIVALFILYKMQIVLKKK